MNNMMGGSERLFELIPGPCFTSLMDLLLTLWFHPHLNNTGKPE